MKIRLIDADALQENAFGVHTQEYGNIDVVGCDAIDDAPTVDIGASGEWVEKHKSTCSLCGYISGEAYLGRAYFCANCGAKMERQNES